MKPQATVNGEEVEVEYYDPEPDAGQPNPGPSLLTAASVGLWGYKTLRGMVGAVPNPGGSKLSNALPWAALAAAAFFAAPRMGRLKVPVQVAGGVAGAKALYELVR